MAQPVWVLSVDLQTKTATFTTGMADAAKSARGSFNDIKQGAQDASTQTGYSMMEARHGVMLLGEEFGVHLPRALTSFITSIGPVGAAMEAAFPFLAIIVGATLLLQHLAKLHEEAEKLTEAQRHFETATLNAFTSLDDKLLQAEIKTDELRGDHIDALRKQLELIDHQSMADLVHQFDIVAKAADAVFAELKTHWYSLGIGAEGAKHALTDFKSSYELLIAQGKDKEASDLLAGTRQSAEKALTLMYQLRDTRMDPGNGQMGDYKKFAEAHEALKQMGVLSKATADITEDEVKAQITLVDALKAQVTVEQKVADLKKAERSNAALSEAKRGEGDADRKMRAEGDAFKKATEEEEREWKERYRVAVGAIQEGEREKIAATDQGSRARLDALNAAIREEETHGLQETGFYKSLLVERLNLTRQILDEESKLKAEAGREDAAHGQKMKEVQLAADREADQLRRSGHRTSIQELLADEVGFENRDYAIKMEAFDKELAALDKHDKDYQNKLKALQNKEEELTKQHENKITQIKSKAEEERNTRILSAETRFNDEVARGLSSVIMGHQSFAAMMASIGDQVASGMIQNAIKSILANDMTKESDAAKAARDGFNAGMKFPFPVNLVMAPTLAAANFARVMAFEGGVDRVPGMGTGDIVPAMLTPGEGIVPGGVMDKLGSLARSGGLDANRAGQVHLHYRPEYHIDAIDGASVRGMLRTHSEEFSQHFHGELRKLNR